MNDSTTEPETTTTTTTTSRGGTTGNNQHTTNESDFILLCQSVNSVRLTESQIRKQIARLTRSTKVSPSTKQLRIQAMVSGKLRQCTSMHCCGGHGRAVDDDDDNETVSSSETLTPAQRRARLTNQVDNASKICTHYAKNNSRFYFACCGVIDPCHRWHLERGTLCDLSLSLSLSTLFFFSLILKYFFLSFFFVAGCDVKPPMITSVCCNQCDMNQPPSEACTTCHIVFSRAHCDKCMLWTSLEIFHCDDCGMCRVGTAESIFHCHKCEACFNVEAKHYHQCNNIPMTQQQCAICFDFCLRHNKDVGSYNVGMQVNVQNFPISPIRIYNNFLIITYQKLLFLFLLPEPTLTHDTT